MKKYLIGQITQEIFSDDERFTANYMMCSTVDWMLFIIQLKNIFMLNMKKNFILWSDWIIYHIIYKWLERTIF